MRRLPQQHRNTPLTRERDRRSVRRQTVLLACCLLLAAGFVIAARQQIAAVQYGYKSEELRRERERLVEEQQRLRVELEAHSSPARLEQAAREVGLQPARAGQIGTGVQAEAAGTARHEVGARPTAARISPTAFVGAARVAVPRR